MQPNDGVSSLGEHSKCEELKKINPDTTIPTMDDDGFVLSERYVCSVHL